MRRRGISRAILARLEAEAAGLGYRRLQLETGLRQPEAIALYESAGYHRIPDYGQYAGDELIGLLRQGPPGRMSGAGRRPETVAPARATGSRVIVLERPF